MLRVCFYINFKLRADVDGDINSGDPSSYYKCCCCRRRRAVNTLTRQEQWIIFSECYSSLSISGAIVKKCRRASTASRREFRLVIIILLLSYHNQHPPATRVYKCYYHHLHRDVLSTYVIMTRIVIIVFYSFVRFNNIMRGDQKWNIACIQGRFAQFLYHPKSLRFS